MEGKRSWVLSTYSGQVRTLRHRARRVFGRTQAAGLERRRVPLWREWGPAPAQQGKLSFHRHPQKHRDTLQTDTQKHTEDAYTYRYTYTDRPTDIQRTETHRHKET